jgi:hypothetical protein
MSFGLINQTYTNQTDASLTQWQAFAREVDRLNAAAAKDTSYKLLFMARHAEGYHNAAETHYGTPEWQRHCVLERCAFHVSWRGVC